MSSFLNLLFKGGIFRFFIQMLAFGYIRPIILICLSFFPDFRLYQPGKWIMKPSDMRNSILISLMVTLIFLGIGFKFTAEISDLSLARPLNVWKRG